MAIPPQYLSGYGLEFQEKKCIFVKNMIKMSAQFIQQPLSNLQLQLLQLYAQNVNEEDLKAIQRLIVRYFAEKATAAADEDWDEKQYQAETLKKEHMRTPYKKLK
jgi:hypothetical protein